MKKEPSALVKPTTQFLKKGKSINSLLLAAFRGKVYHSASLIHPCFATEPAAAGDGRQAKPAAPAVFIKLVLLSLRQSSVCL